MPRGVALPRAQTLGELSERLGGELDRALEACVVERVVSPADASTTDELVPLSSSRQLAAALAAPGVILCDAALAARVPAGRRWVHEHVMWVVARLLSPLEAAGARDVPVQGAAVAPGATVASDARIGAGAVVMKGARVGGGCVVGPNAVIYGGVWLGEGVVVGPCAVIGRAGFGWAEGPGGDAVRIPHLGGVVVEDDVEIGALCTIDAGTLGPTRIGRGVKLDAHVHVGHNASIGAGTLVAAQSGFAGSAMIGRRVRIGGQAGITDHARVGDGARIAAKSGVIGDVPEAVTVAGFPAIPRVRWLRAMARLTGGTGDES